MIYCYILTWNIRARWIDWRLFMAESSPPSLAASSSQWPCLYTIAYPGYNFFPIWILITLLWSHKAFFLLLPAQVRNDNGNRRQKKYLLLNVCVHRNLCPSGFSKNHFFLSSSQNLKQNWTSNIRIIFLEFLTHRIVHKILCTLAGCVFFYSAK